MGKRADAVNLTAGKWLRALPGQDYPHPRRQLKADPLCNDEGARFRGPNVSRASAVCLDQAMPAALSAALTCPGLIGDSRTRAPVASNTAFATAAAIGAVGGSPEPVASSPVARCRAGGDRRDVGPLDDLEGDLRRILEAEDRVGDPVEARHVPLVEHDCSKSAAAQALRHAADGLVLDPAGIHR